MYTTVVSPPASPIPASPRIARNSYSLPPQNGSQRLSQRSPPHQAQTTKPPNLAIIPPAQAAKKIQGTSLNSPELQAFELEKSAKVIQQSFKKSPAFKKFERQVDTRKRVDDFYNNAKQHNDGGGGSRNDSNRNRRRRGGSDEGSDSYESDDENRRRGGRARNRRRNKNGRSGGGGRRRHRNRRRRADSFDDGSGDSEDFYEDSDDSYDSDDSDDSYDDRRRRGGRKKTRRGRNRRSRSQKRRGRKRRSGRGGSRRRDASDSDDYSDNDDDRNTKRRDRQRGKDGRGKDPAVKNKKGSTQKKAKVSLEDRMTGAATKIQAFVRARQTYRAWENTTYPYLIRWKQQTAVVADNLVSELLEDEVIPDVLIDIFSHAGDVDDPFAPNPEEDRQVWSLWVEIVNEVVAELGDGVCRQVIQSFVNGYLQTRREAEQISPDPVAVVIEDIAGEVADDAAKKIVGECINEMVQSYLRQQTADDFLNTTLQPLIAEVAHLAMDDLEVDNIVADMVEEYILATSQEVASESFLEMKDTIFDERQRRQYSEVAEAAQRIFDNTSLRMLVRTMATNAESILMRDYMNRLASGMLVRTIFAKLQRVQKHDNGMLRNRPMRHFHQEVTSRIAIHQMLTMLPEQLTKDEADIDARENLDGFSLDEEMEKAEVAVRIQARYRGRAQRLAAKRKERKEQEKAALVIQARLRGRSVRKQMKDEKEMQAKLYGRD